MNRRARLMATLRGEPVDRPAVSFYEIEGLRQRPDDPDPFHIYTDPSWAPAIRLAVERSDRIGLGHVPVRRTAVSALDEVTTGERTVAGDGSLHVVTTMRLPGRTLVRRARRDPDVDTVWTLEHPLKDVDDLQAWLDMPEDALEGEADPARFLADEAGLGDSGIMMVNIADPVCRLAELFEFGVFTVMAMTEPILMHRALDRLARTTLWETERIACAVPGRLWRIVGPEYVTAPYLPPAYFRDYVVRHDGAMIEMVHRHGGFARLHCHGRIRDVLDDIAAMSPAGLDPIEPPPQGDVELAWVKARVGDRMVLFGNLEASDLENLDVDAFAKKIDRALREGTAGGGRGFVLMPSASPYGRHLSSRALRNYERMVAMAENWKG